MLKNLLFTIVVDIIYEKKFVPLKGENEVTTMCDSMCEELHQGQDREEEILVPSSRRSRRHQSNRRPKEIIIDLGKLWEKTTTQCIDGEE